MPDTKITNTTQGWIDNDDPNKFYNVRRLARDARRAKRLGHATVTTTNLTTVGFASSQTGLPTGQVVLSSLQQRLFDRLTAQQGVSIDDAMDIITNNGYNKAASYGHMRAAGATHAEAEIVISLNSPDVSLAYGKARAGGDHHTHALGSALNA